jgi:hypothetical protein
MAGRIILVRHGPSAHIHTGAIDRAGLEKWRDAYDAAGIQSTCRPPAELMRIVADADHVIASDLPRAIASAERVAPGREVRVSDLFREIPLDIPRWPTRLPLSGWSTLIFLSWVARIIRGIDHSAADRARAVSAGKLLAEIVADGSTAVVLTHGVFRRHLARQLVRDGWVSMGRQSGYQHWSAWHFAR